MESSNIICRYSWLKFVTRAGSACTCLCVMWKTNERCNVGYWPSPALLFLRANPAASPPLPPPPQPLHKLYNGELLSLCYLTPTTHYAFARFTRDREAEEGRGVRAWEAERRENRLVSAQIGTKWKKNHYNIIVIFLQPNLLPSPFSSQCNTEEHLL